MNYRTLSSHSTQFLVYSKVSMIDFETMKERRSFKQNPKIREKQQSAQEQKGREGRKSGDRGGAEGPGWREAGSSLHQCKKPRGVIGADRYLQNSRSSPLEHSLPMLPAVFEAYSAGAPPRTKEATK
jgi:hypothetical protein